MDSLNKQLEQVATDLVMVDPADLPALAKLHDTFLGLGKAVDDKTSPLSKIIQGCGDLVKRIVLDNVDCKETALSTLNEAVTGLQSVIRDKRELSDVQFPPEFMDAIKADAPTADDAPEESPEDDDPDSESHILSFENVDTEIMAEFITEGREHCTLAEQMMMDLETGSDQEAAVGSIFRSFHTIKGGAGMLDLEPISVVAHESETLLDLAREGKVAIEGRIADVIFASIDTLRELLDCLEEGLRTGEARECAPIMSSVLGTLREILKDPTKGAGEEVNTRVGDILIDMGTISQKQIDDTLANKEQKKERLGEALVKQGVVPAKTVARALRFQKQIRKSTPGPVVSAVREKVRIDTERLDRLVDTIGELVVAESMVGQDEEFISAAPPRIVRNVSHLNKITRELQEMGMSLRLVPVRPTFQKLARAARDLSKKSGKKISLTMSGEDTEVDRTIIENISDPLMHIIRNSMDHAIELPGNRTKAGKPEVGQIWLRAFHRSGNIHFEVEDDGQGLDKDRIFAKAREKGLIDANAELSDKEIFNLILLPGFSTAKKITDVSGRGVGMDVVKKNLDVMRGHLEIASVRHEGTTLTMKLPLTLAIIDGMMVRIAQEKYILPTISVVESLHLAPGMVTTVGGKGEMINLRGKLLPLIRTADLFGLTPEGGPRSEDVVVVVEDGEKQTGLVVGELLGQRQTVIKSLESKFVKQKWISGGAIMSSGNVGLIIDIGGLIEMANEQDREMAVVESPVEMEEDHICMDASASTDQNSREDPENLDNLEEELALVVAD